MIHAILLESNPDFTLMLPCACEGVGISLTVVSTLEAVQRATRRAGPDDFVIGDLSLNLPADKDRCVEITRHSDLDVHVIYKPGAPDHTAFVGRMERAARGDLTWLPATVGLVELLDILRSLQKAALARCVRAKPLSPRQEDVLALIAHDLSYAEIADALKITSGAVKQHVARIEDKLDVGSKDELKIAHRWMTTR